MLGKVRNQRRKKSLRGLSEKAKEEERGKEGRLRLDGFCLRAPHFLPFQQMGKFFFFSPHFQFLLFSIEIYCSLLLLPHVRRSKLQPQVHCPPPLPPSPSSRIDNGQIYARAADPFHTGRGQLWLIREGEGMTTIDDDEEEEEEEEDVVVVGSLNPSPLVEADPIARRGRRAPHRRRAWKTAKWRGARVYRRE